MLQLIPFALAVLGAAIPLVGSGFSPWPMALAWLAGVGALLLIPRVVDLDRRNRVFIDFVAIVMTLVVLAPEGGWWFVPAVVAQLLLDGRTARRAADAASNVAASATDTSLV